MKTLEERFWAKVDKSGECWVWTGSRDQKGYGRIKHEERPAQAHRVSATLAGMNIDGMHVCHHCDNTSCVRPGHLFVGTHKDNMRDMLSKGRHRFDPHPGERNGLAKLTEDQVHWVRASKLQLSVVADWLGVSVSAISLIRHRKTWKHI